MIEEANITIRGLVQGVFFRATALQQAQQLGLTGLIRNLDDGSVNAVVQGEKQDLIKFIDWCHKGPKHARVENVSVEYKPIKNPISNLRIID